MTSQVKVDSIRHTGASADAITLASDGSCIAELTNRQGTNLLINGDCRIAQRGTSSTSTGYQTLDRWNSYNTSHSVTITISQQSLSSSDTGPWAKGFRKCSRIALSGAGTAAVGTQIFTVQHLEAQDIANSGWDYTSSSSYLTLSFWVRSSTAQDFPIGLYTKDGTEKLYTTTYTISSANTWEKKTIKIPGATGLQFDDNNGEGLRVYLACPYHGTNFTSGATNATWVDYHDTKKFIAVPSTWLTAGASTFDFTGAQLEVGEFASEFEHRSYGDELARCQRYFQVFAKGESAFFAARGSGSNTALFSIPLTTPLRNTPTLYWASTYYYKYDGKDSTSTDPSIVDWHENYTQVGMSAGGLSGVDDDRTSTIFCFGGDGNTPPYDGYFDSEL